MKIKCWEYKKCEKIDCPVYKKDNIFCWMCKGTKCDETSQFDLDDRLKRCINCEVLRLNLFDALNTHNLQEEFIKPFYILLKQLEEYKTQLIMSHTISKLMQSTIDLEKILHIILTCVTASYGLGFNRALLLLINKEKYILNGIMAVGPTSKDEAYRIWQELSTSNLPPIGFDNIVEVYNGTFRKRESPMDSIAQRIHINIKDNNIFSESFTKKEFFIITDAKNNPRVPKEFVDIWTAQVFALVPLFSRNSVLGNIVVDNIYNERPITTEHIELLKGFASQAGLAIDNAMLYENIENKLEELENLNIKLQEINDMLLRSEKLSAIGEMASTTAHEIRNPLIAIGGFARLIRDEVDKESLKNYSDIIIKEVARLEKIIGGILDFVRETKLVLKQTDINKLIRETLLLVNSDIIKYNIEGEINLDNDLPQILTDSERIKQVLINIFNNAIDAMSNGSNRKLYITTFSKDNFVKIEIKDTGKGIAKSELDNICKPFFTTKEKGTGLGLYIADKIIREHEGSLKVISNLGIGTSFTINLPIRR